MVSQETQDFHMAYDMHEKLNCLGVTENAVSLNKVFIVAFFYREWKFALNLDIFITRALCALGMKIVNFF